jgi:hypothetical protein
MRKENFVLEAGNWLLDEAKRGLPQQACMLGENQDPWGKTPRRKRAVRGRGVGCGVSTAPLPAATQAHAAHRTLGISRSMRRLGLPLFNTRSFWSLRPPAPAAGRTKTVKIILQQDRGGGADGERAVASATTSILHKAHNEKNTPHPLKHRQSLCPHPRGTHGTFTPKKPRAPRGMGNFSGLGMDGRGWPHG